LFAGLVMLGAEFLGLAKQAAITPVNLEDAIEGPDRIGAIASFLQSLANKLRVFANKFNVKHM
jgi:hypothetical protein